MEILFACHREEKLPFFGEEEVLVDELGKETVRYNRIPGFEFVNQYGEIITQRHFADKIYIADFFFTSCPTICPVMGGNKYRIQQAFKNEPGVLILSHSIDPKHDTVEVLREYAERMGSIRNKWHLVTGAKDHIYALAKEYYVTAAEDDRQAGSFIHDGSFLLIDRNKYIRGIYDGTDTGSTDRLIADVKRLLNE